MKKIAIVALIAFIGFVQQSNAQAKIEFKNDVIDYGEIAKGSDGIRTFEFTNVGDAPLVISNVKSSCGCTVPSKPDGPVAQENPVLFRLSMIPRELGQLEKQLLFIPMQMSLLFH